MRIYNISNALGMEESSVIDALQENGLLDAKYTTNNDRNTVVFSISELGKCFCDYKEHVTNIFEIEWYVDKLVKLSDFQLLRGSYKGSVIDLQRKIEHALYLIARATIYNPKRAMRAVKHYNKLMAQKQKKLQEILNDKP